MFGGGNEIASKTEDLKPNPSKRVLLIVILRCQDGKAVQSVLSGRMGMRRFFWGSRCVIAAGCEQGGGKTGIRKRGTTLSSGTLDSASSPVK